MIYAVEFDFTCPDLESEWHAWYADYLQNLLSVPGFHTAQRFKADPPSKSPYLALYSVDSADILQSPAYKNKGGPTAPGKWTACMKDWHRNVFDGVDKAPEVSPHQVIVVVDRPQDAAWSIPAGFACWPCVALDRTVAERGIRICSPGEAGSAASEIDPQYRRAFKPISRLLRSKE